MRAAAILFVLSHQTLRNALDYFRMVPAALFSALKHATTPATGQEIPKANQLIFGRRKHSGGMAVAVFLVSATCGNMSLEARTTEDTKL
jgi:hypothetical protein